LGAEKTADHCGGFGGTSREDLWSQGLSPQTINGNSAKTNIKGQDPNETKTLSVLLFCELN
jgi:hypothetical protein